MAEYQEQQFVRRIPLEEKTCPVCGKAFVGPKRQICCSVSCQQKAIYQRHAEERRAKRRERYRRGKGKDATDTQTVALHA